MTSQADEWQWYLQGANLDLDTVAELEARLLQDPEDFESRCKVLSALHLPQHTKPELRARFDLHAEWLIRHRPDSILARVIPLAAHAWDEEDRRRRHSAIWQEIVDARGDEPAVLGNAAQFFTFHEPARAKELLLRARRLDPNEARWPAELGKIALRAAERAGESDPTGSYSEALEYLEESLAKVGDHEERSDWLGRTAEAALGLGDHAKATTNARQLLLHAQSSGDSADRGNAVHDGNRVLGFVALRDGRIEEACERLIESGRTPGSPTLNSFGPQFDVASELLERGQRAAVLEYLELCSRFWRNPSVKVWIEEMHQGLSPQLRRFGI
jgi:tetratricopeptide (TPR) repeat protein